MNLKIIVLILSVFCIGNLSAQDNPKIEEIRKELQEVKALREKDSLKIALLLHKIETLDNPTEKTDSVYLKQKAEIDNLREKVSGFPLVFYGDTLYSVYSSLGPYDVQTRVKHLEEKLYSLYKKPFFFSDSLKVKHSNGFFNINYQNEVISAITATDALWANTTAEELANNQTKIIKESIVKHRKQNSLKNNIFRIAELLLIIGIALGLIWLMNRFFRFFKGLFLTPKNRFLKGIKIKNYEIVKQKHILRVLDKIISLFKIVLIFLLFVTVIPLAFSIFPSTQNWSEVIREWLWDPVKKIWISVLTYFPKLITIAIILFIVHHILRFLRFLALEIERGVLNIKGFYPEWAKTTYSLVRFVLLMLTLVVIFPYLPGSDSDAFKGISVFLGILISVGSSSAVANAVAGLVITYMRPFQKGDWIKTGDVIGIVIEKNALVTRLKTINNEDVSVPNSSVLSGATINYSSLGRSNGLVITAKIKARYDYSHNLIEELLLEAALRTKDVSKTPHPYVFQLSLEEVNVVYELNAFTFAPENMYFIKSDLIKNIQNVFRQAKVEIHSTQYVEIKGTGFTK